MNERNIMKDSLKPFLIISLFFFSTLSSYCWAEPFRPAAVPNHSNENPVKINSIKTVRDKDRTLDWSHHNGLIAFSLLGSDGYYDLATMRADGSDVKCLTCDIDSMPNKNIGNPAWHPSGKYIIVQVEKMKHFGPSFYSNPGIGYNCDLWVVTSDGKNAYRLTSIPTKRNIASKTPVSGVLHAHFSPDGNRLVWGQLKRSLGRGSMGQWEIKLSDFMVKNGIPALSNIKTLTPGKQKQWYETHGFSPDGRKIIFSGNLLKGQPDTGMDIYTIDTKTSKVTPLTHSFHRWDEHAHYSPDGKKIIWIASVNRFSPKKWRKTMQAEYFVMNADGTNKQQLTYFNTPGHPHYSIFNGKRVICADSAWNAEGDKIMASIAVDGKLYIMEIGLSY
jgi:Tol biopolymer transport system component